MDMVLMLLLIIAENLVGLGYVKFRFVFLSLAV